MKEIDAFSVYRFLLFSQHLSKVITRVRWKIAQSIALMRESVTYPVRNYTIWAFLFIPSLRFSGFLKLPFQDSKSASYASWHLYESYWVVPWGWSFQLPRRKSFQLVQAIAFVVIYPFYGTHLVKRQICISSR